MLYSWDILPGKINLLQMHTIQSSVTLPSVHTHPSTHIKQKALTKSCWHRLTSALDSCRVITIILFIIRGPLPLLQCMAQSLSTSLIHVQRTHRSFCMCLLERNGAGIKLILNQAKIMSKLFTHMFNSKSTFVIL